MDSRLARSGNERSWPGTRRGVQLGHGQRTPCSQTPGALLLLHAASVALLGLGGSWAGKRGSSDQV